MNATPQVNPYHAPTRMHTTLEFAVEMMSTDMESFDSQHTVQQKEFVFFVTHQPTWRTYPYLRSAALGPKEAVGPLADNQPTG